MLRPVLVRPERVDRLQQERDREQRVDRDDAAFDLALERRQTGAEAGLRCEDDERGVEAAHQDQRQPRVAVAQIELIVALVERVVQRAIELPGAKRTGAVQLLGLPFQAAACPCRRRSRRARVRCPRLRGIGCCRAGVRGYDRRRVIIYGINPVFEAIKAGRVKEIRVAQRADDRLQKLLEEAARQQRARAVRDARRARSRLETRRAPGRRRRGRAPHRGHARGPRATARTARRSSSSSTKSRIRRTSARFCEASMPAAGRGSSGRRDVRRPSTAPRPRPRRAPSITCRSPMSSTSPDPSTS